MKLGVPCSRIKEKITGETIPCPNEETAYGIAFGYLLSGNAVMVYMQNSGLGRVVDILQSLYRPYGMEYPSLILSVRCKPEHHRYMSKITYPLLSLVEYPLNKIEITEESF